MRRSVLACTTRRAAEVGEVLLRGFRFGFNQKKYNLDVLRTPEKAPEDHTDC